MKKEIVVAHYNEELRWINAIPEEWQVAIYEKGNATPEGIEKRPYVFEFLENTGREGSSFLHHIISRYDAEGVSGLADVTVFLQGNPFEHMAGTWGGDLMDLGELLDRPWTTTSAWGLGSWLVSNKDGSPHHLPPTLPIAEMAELVGLPIADTIPFVAGGQWVVGKEVILQHPKWFYELLLGRMLEHEVWGYCLERLWARIWSPKFDQILYYSHHTETNPRVPRSIQRAVVDQIDLFRDGPVTVVTPPNINFGEPFRYGFPVAAPPSTGQWNIDIYKAIEAGLLAIDPGVLVYLAEHDVLYPADYWLRGREQYRPGHIGYANNVCFLNAVAYWTYRPSTFQSTCYGERDVLLAEVRRRLAYIDEHKSSPPTFDLGRGDGQLKAPLFEYASINPVLDIRFKEGTAENVSPTGTFDKGHTFYERLPYWGKASKWIEKLKLTETHGFYVLDIKDFPQFPYGEPDEHER